MISRAQIQRISVTILVSGSSLVGILIEPFIKELPLERKLIFVVILSPIYYFIVYVSSRLLRYIYYYRIVGEWYYVTISNSGYQNENYARMFFFFDRDGLLRYEVILYPNLISLQNDENINGKAMSEALDYDRERNELHILYNVSLIEDNLIRRGRLFLTVSRSNTLTGEWSSVLSGDTVSRGRMFAARKREFEAKSESWVERQRSLLMEGE